VHKLVINQSQPMSKVRDSYLNKEAVVQFV
jgi:hypothetical protein